MHLLLDIGATTTKIGISKNLNKIDKFFIIETPKNYNDFLQVLKNNLKEIRFNRIVIGFAGMIRNEKIIKVPNLPNFNNKNIVKDFKNLFNCDVILKNDAELAGLGEAVYGIGKRFNILGYVTLSSGVGGVKIVNKKVEENFFGFEPGHSLFLLNSNFIEVEKLIGGKSIEKITGKKPEEIKDKKFWSYINKIFAGFLINVAIFWSVEAIIIGGSLIKSLDFEELKVNFSNLKTLPFKTKIFKSKLQEKSGIYGGLYLLKTIPEK